MFPKRKNGENFINQIGLLALVTQSLFTSGCLLIKENWNKKNRTLATLPADSSEKDTHNKRKETGRKRRKNSPTWHFGQT